MKISDLVRYGIPGDIIRLWQERVGERLLPLQAEAVQRHGLFDGGNLLVQAPTTSGKTFVGEMAAVQAAMARKKVIYLAPLKALAAEKFAEFERKYAPYGMRVLLSTRDHREHDADLEAGRFSIAVVVYEKLAQLLVRRPEQIQELGLVVADEMELMGDPERGPGVETLLTQLGKAGVRVVGLSAVLGNADKLARWMEATLVEHDRRPIELRYGVLHEGTFRYRTHNALAEGEEPLVDCPSDSPWDMVMENVAALAGRDEPCLIFVRDRYESRKGARRLAHRLELTAATEAIDTLRGLEKTHAREELCELLAQGVAFHNADLTPDERRCVEEAFRREEVRVMVSTSTLAAGLNLPVQNVFLTADKWRYDERFGMPWKAPLERGEYENMGGRAGRYGSGKDFGRAVLVAATAFDQETLWRRYVEGGREHLATHLHRRPMEDQLLRLIASGAGRTCAELTQFLLDTPTGHWHWRECCSMEELRSQVQDGLHRLIDAGMAAWGGPGEEDMIEATPLGHAAAAKGIRAATAQAMAAWLRESETRDWHPADAAFAAALTPDGRMNPMCLTTQEYEGAKYADALRHRLKNEELTANTPCNRLRNSPEAPLFEEIRAVKTTLVLLDWIDEQPVYDIEEKYKVLCGQLLAASEQIAWLMEATAAIARASGARQPCIDALGLLARRMAKGVRQETLPLASLHRPRLARSIVLRLAEAGYAAPETLAAVEPEQLRRWMSMRDARALVRWAQRQIGASSAQGEAPSTSSAHQPVLVVDERRPQEICLAGRHIVLREKEYRLIRLLAERPGQCVEYPAIQDALWGEQVVNANQMSSQKSSLLKRIAEEVQGFDELIRTVPKRGFVLELEPEEVEMAPLSTAA